MVEPGVALQLLALGLGAGFLAGLLGIGGGMLMVPFLSLILLDQGVPAGLNVKMAIATAMATILFTSISSLRAHHRRGNVRWDLVLGLAPGIVVGGLVAGAGIFAWVKGPGLALAFAVFVWFSALQMMLDRKPKPGREVPGVAGLAAAGGLFGLVSGLVGAGGAFMSSPFMLWCNVPMHRVVATSAALGFPIALANTAGYLISGRNLPASIPGALGYLYLPALVMVAVASMAAAPWGVRAAQALDTRQLKRVFSVLLLVLGGTMLREAWRAWP